MEVDDESWEVQNNRRRGRGENIGHKSEITNFFVSNIPQGCRPWDFANSFREYGEIAGAFFANKKDKEGRIFGFVSFRGVRDVEDLKHSISNVKLGGNKLLINVALFARENGEAKSSKVHGGGVKSAVDGQYKEQTGKPRVNWYNSVMNGVLFLDILTNKSHATCEEDVVVIDPSTFSLSKLTGRAAVGRALGFNDLRLLKSSLWATGFEDASLQYLGGLWVLISFKDGDSVKSLIDDKDVWKNWLSSLNPWIGQPYLMNVLLGLVSSVFPRIWFREEFTMLLVVDMVR
ncbi:putative RNA recognition motif domain, nucleotide-binding alpha-beta plait domain superfamily [Helianthus debilis subsp. tardiflorus]